MPNWLVLLVFWVILVGTFGAAGNDDYNRKCANAHKMNPSETCVMVAAK